MLENVQFFITKGKVIQTQIQGYIEMEEARVEGLRSTYYSFVRLKKDDLH